MSALFGDGRCRAECRVECRVAMTSPDQRHREQARRSALRDKTPPPLQWWSCTSTGRAAA